ncbi:type II toxin-antitoxin system VapC family toxin [Sphingomonas sp.]|uniref:type II toxin-antitoxin system VapC family toxin n=1 Tax=Sphingomonas sp. TaxID=28214 RepID=UPI002E3538CA|nr:type II toxin-antitoxin system VapC family toxin [Sphingomonas sp.]HEX4694792.1 type II toxin-antitoxin system VapC family toxin [Sphingomonas sp.]
MSGYSFDSNILIDSLNGNAGARGEIARVEHRWISRVTWIEVLSKERGGTLRVIEAFLRGFAIDEVDERIAGHAAALRRERPRLKLADSVILASAQVNHRILVTRNTRDFPAAMPGIRVPNYL